jgi:hypothetical protein
LGECDAWSTPDLQASERAKHRAGLPATSAVKESVILAARASMLFEHRLEARALVGVAVADSRSLI